MPASDASPAKRQRTDDVSKIVPVRSEFWPEDGNVILQAEGTQFKVHRGILSMNSDVFKDMLSLPQLSSGEELIDGCPVVHLSDSAADVAFVLQALCQRRYVVFLSISVESINHE